MSSFSVDEVARLAGLARIALTPKEVERLAGELAVIADAVAKVSDSLFWLALSGLDQDVSRNIQLLKERPWIDIPIRYGNRRRAILTFEKGAPGERAFNDAFAAWGE